MTTEELNAPNLIRNIVTGSKVISIKDQRTAVIDHEMVYTKIKNGRVSSMHGVILKMEDGGQGTILMDAFRNQYRLAEGEPASTW